MLDATNHPPLVSADALRRLIGTPRLLILDCRFDLMKSEAGRAAYAAGHIPGAVFAPMEHDLAAPRGARGGRHPLPSPADFAAALGRWGFTPSSHVIAYDQASGAWAARLWWMLRARGHRRVQVLDGGFDAWLAAGGVAVTAVPAIEPSVVEPVDFAGVVNAEELAAGLARGELALVDARAADRFAGRNEGIDPVAGHVPGAINHPFTQNLRDGQHWHEPAMLREALKPVTDRAGGASIASMCGSGITACHNLLALELAGYRDTRLYAGSWSDWITDPARPVATGDNP